MLVFEKVLKLIEILHISIKKSFLFNQTVNEIYIIYIKYKPVDCISLAC